MELLQEVYSVVGCENSWVSAKHCPRSINDIPRVGSLDMVGNDGALIG